MNFTLDLETFLCRAPHEFPTSLAVSRDVILRTKHLTYSILNLSAFIANSESSGARLLLTYLKGRW